MEAGIPDEIKEVAKDALVEVSKEVYEDLIQPTVKPIGQIFSYLPRAVRLGFSGLERWIINGEESLRLTSESLQEKTKNIPIEKLVEPEPHIAIPAIQQLSYCQNSEELRDLYANLLASSMNTDKKWKVHPAFVDIVKQLTPDEAKMLKSLPPSIVISHPLIDVRLQNKQRGKGGNTLYSNFTNVGLDRIETQSQISSYIDNLERLKLIVIPPTKSLTDKALYNPLLKHPNITAMIPKNLPNDIFEIGYEYKIFNLTNFGLSFIETCCI